MAAAKSKWASPAQVNAILRYAPQRQALADLTREAKEQYGASVAGAESTGRLTTAAIDKAQPQASAIYDRAQQSTSGAQQQLASVLAGLGSGANPFRAAAATEQAGGESKLARERAATEGNLVEQRSAAAEAPQFASTLANQQLAKSLSKIFSSEQSIAGQEGDATASEQQRIEKEARQTALTERGQNITAQSDTEGHKLTASGLVQKAAEHQEDLAAKREAAKNGGEQKPLTPHEQNEGLATIQQIAQIAKSTSGNRAARVAALTEGTSSTSRSYKKGENVNGEEIKQNTTISSKAVPAFSPDVLMSAALDVVEHSGHLTRNTAHRLEQNGYNVKRLGLPVLSTSAERVRSGAAKAGQQITAGVRGL